jgi:hypothetical protein
MPLPGEETLTTAASYGLLGLRPESIESVPLATRDEMRGYGQDIVLSFLGKRAKRPVLSWDKALERAAVVKAFEAAILYRGARPNGQDATIIQSAVKDVDAWLLLVAKGDREPYFTDSSPARDEMGPLAGSTRLSDAKMRHGCCRPTRRMCKC